MHAAACESCPRATSASGLRPVSRHVTAPCDTLKNGTPVVQPWPLNKCIYHSPGYRMFEETTRETLRPQAPVHVFIPFINIPLCYILSRVL